MPSLTKKNKASQNAFSDTSGQSVSHTQHTSHTRSKGNKTHCGTCPEHHRVLLKLPNMAKLYGNFFCPTEFLHKECLISTQELWKVRWKLIAICIKQILAMYTLQLRLINVTSLTGHLADDQNRPWQLRAYWYENETVAKRWRIEVGASFKFLWVKFSIF